jgi:hypothetical protein
MSKAEKKCSRTLLRWHQPLPGAAQRQLNPKCCRQEKVDFPGFEFLQIARRNFGFFRQLILRQTPAHPFATDICAKNLDSLPFFFGNSHDILHRGSAKNMNDTYIVKRFGFYLLENRVSANTVTSFGGR